jgi:hypothetical protein
VPSNDDRIRLRDRVATALEERPASFLTFWLSALHLAARGAYPQIANSHLESATRLAGLNEIGLKLSKQLASLYQDEVAYPWASLLDSIDEWALHSDVSSVVEYAASLALSDLDD